MSSGEEPRWLVLSFPELIPVVGANIICNDLYLAVLSIKGRKYSLSLFSPPEMIKNKSGSKRGSHVALYALLIIRYRKFYHWCKFVFKTFYRYGGSTLLIPAGFWFGIVKVTFHDLSFSQCVHQM